MPADACCSVSHALTGQSGRRTAERTPNKFEDGAFLDSAGLGFKLKYLPNWQTDLDGA